ncbi:MAG: hypothetical protein DMG64_10460 [Acidobacteria bacterium]|nr:MAG: hypothetical protein DMG63_13395 [Acidobacteriota bacterium]PYY02791.1 MAG: hypothetical protein DMG64_10460 [Acidobacteriota bacterium]
MIASHADGPRRSRLLTKMSQFTSIPFQDKFGGEVPKIGIPAASHLELSRLAEQLMCAVPADGVAIALQSPRDHSMMVCIARCGDAAPPLRAVLDVNSGISGLAVRENHILYSSDTGTDPRVDTEVCERLRIRSVVAVPISRDSRCIGVLEVLSSDPGAFDRAALRRIKAEAVRALGLVDQRRAELNLPDPEDWEGNNTAFKLNSDGRLSPLTMPSFQQYDGSHAVLSQLRNFGIQSLKQWWRWIALASVAASLAFSAPRLIRRANAPSQISATRSTAANHVNMPFVTVSPESTSELISDATPAVRALMAMAIGGNHAAQASLADHYASGTGVMRDPVKAAVWAVIASTKSKGRSAANVTSNLQPYELGQVEFNLGIMFRDGIGTSPEFVAAYSWFSLSEATGDVRASAALLNLQQLMSPDQIFEAQHRAPELLHQIKK